MKDTIPLSELVQLLECPVCLKFPETETNSILQCRNGHIGCLDCFSMLAFCPGIEKLKLLI